MKRAGREGVAAEESRGGPVERAWRKMRYIFKFGGRMEGGGGGVFRGGPGKGVAEEGCFRRGPSKGVAEEDTGTGRRAAAEGC